MNQEYYDVVGKAMIDSFLQYTAYNCKLRVYAENITSSIPIDNRIDYYDWNISCKKSWQQFKNKCTDNLSVKFAKKGFAFLHALETIKERYFVWIDADILFLKSIDKKFLISTIQDNLIGIFDHSYLNLGGYSAESGYVIIDTQHKSFNKFVELYKKYYTADSKPAQIDRWYDGQICMLAASEFKKVYNLSKLSYNNTSHTPLNDSPLNEYIVHYKGKKRKRFIKNTK